VTASAAPRVEPTPVLEVRGISKTYGATHALTDVNITLMSGEIHGLAGENGAGKSTLIKVMSGAIFPDNGDVLVDGQRLRFHGPRDAIYAGVRVVHQELSVINHLSIAENLLLGDLPRKYGLLRQRELRDHAEKLLEPVGMSDFDVRLLVGQLSLGQKQLVEIARALRGKPRVLLLDEPSAILGADDLGRLFATLRGLVTDGVCILYISHRLGEIFDLTQRVTILRDGRHIDTVETRALDEETLIQHMTGRQLTAPGKKHIATSTGIPVLQADDIWSGHRVKGVSIQVYAGEVVCLTGLVGSGRTELARAIIGADGQSKGSILINGTKRRVRNPRVGRRLGIGYLPENRKEAGLLLNRSILENLGLASLRFRSRFGVIDKRRDVRAGANLVKLVDIRCRSVDRLVSELSGGNQQKVLIARWLAAHPQLLILDEPTRGVDVGGKGEIYRVIRDLADSGVAVLVISSEIEEVLMISDRVLVMREGRLSGAFTGSEITEDSVMQAVLRNRTPVEDSHA